MNFYGNMSNYDLSMSFKPVIVSLIKNKRTKTVEPAQGLCCGINTRLSKIL